MSDDKPSSRTSQKLRETNKHLIISEIRSLNARVADLLEQFSLLTMEISNVADDLERHQVGMDTMRVNFKDLKGQFTTVSEALESTRDKVAFLEKKLAEVEQRSLNLGTYHVQVEGASDD